MNGETQHRSGLGETLLVVTMIYVLAGLLALFAIPASAFGWAGMEPDPLSAVIALVLALPWTVILYFMGDVGTWGTLAFCAAAIAFNAYILWRLSRR